MERTSDAAIIKLDWSRLLGFDRIERNPAVEPITELKDCRLAELGAKVGVGGRCT